MSSKYYLGKNHIFTSRSENEKINIKAGAGEILNIPNGVSVGNSFLSIRGNGNVNLPFNTSLKLTNAYWNIIDDTSTQLDPAVPTFNGGTITINKTGVYILTFSVGTTNFPSNGIFKIWPQISGFTGDEKGQSKSTVISANSTSLCFTGIYLLSENQTVEIYAYQANATSSSAVNTSTADEGTLFLYRMG